MGRRNLGFNKIARDLWLYKSRSLLVIIAVTVGVAAFGMMNTGRIIVDRMFRAGYVSIHPAHAIIGVQDFGEGLVRRVLALPGVEAVEARRVFFAKIRSPQGAWLPLMLFAVPDLKVMQIDQVDWLGAAPLHPATDTIVFDHQIDSLTPLKRGDPAQVRSVLGDDFSFKTAGFVNEITQSPSRYTLLGYGFISLKTAEKLGEPPLYNELHIITDVTDADRSAIEKRISGVIEVIKADGYEVLSSSIPEPGIHPHSDIVSSIIVVLQALGVLILALSIVVVGNVVAALMAQQKPQIAILKSIGATRRQIIGLYLSMIFIIGTIALVLAIPIGLGGAYGLVFGVLQSVDFPFVPFALPLNTILWQVALAYLVPLIAILGPILSSSRITIREALSDAPAEMLGGWTKLLSRGSLLARGAVRNTFRRKERLALTLLTLSIGGAMFIAVFGLRDALYADFRKMLASENYAIAVDLARPYPIEELKRSAFKVAGIAAAEGWLRSDAAHVYANGTLSGGVPVFGVPADTTMAKPLLLQGRWFDENSAATIVLSNKARQNMGLAAGVMTPADANLPIRAGLGEKKARPMQQTAILASLDSVGYVPYHILAAALHLDKDATRLVVRTTQDGPAFQAHVESALLDRLDKDGIVVVNSSRRAVTAQAVLSSADTISGVLLASVLITVLVGGIGLSSTLGINVLERTREIGVLRSIGTTGNLLGGMVLAEGLVISLISVPVAVLLSLPMQRLLAKPLGETFIGQPLSFVFSPLSLALWLGIIVVVTYVASITPVRNAARLTIREAIAYTG